MLKGYVKNRCKKSFSHMMMFIKCFITHQLVDALYMYLNQKKRYLIYITSLNTYNIIEERTMNKHVIYFCILWSMFKIEVSKSQHNTPNS